MDYVDSPSRCPPPRLLEVGLICEQFNCSPKEFGFDVMDPRIVRNIRTALNVYHTAQARHETRDKSKWDRENPAGTRLLRWARGGESQHPGPFEVKVQIPQRPKN